MQFPDYNPQQLEPQILEFWKKNKILDSLRKRNKKGKKFYFLDGPPYTSGKFHLGHAWNYALKDITLRYKRMQGLKVWDRNGFDVHGLPTEHKVMEKFGLKTKEDIQKFGLDKFMQECEKFCLEMAEVMTKDLQRMGVTVDTSNPYMALKSEFMEGEWALIKKAWENKRLYFGEKVLTWCQHCETAVAKHECEYKKVKDTSIYVKFNLKKKKDEFLIIWTTTPWTIPFNLAVMAGPDIEYVKVQVGKEKWIVAKELAGKLLSLLNEEVRIIEEFKGKKLEGLEYSHPFEKIIPTYAELKKKHPKVHTVILSKEFVDTSTGTGLVHSAPGCGPEDQEACKPYHIPPFNPIAENGIFPKILGPFAGLKAKINDHQFIEALEKENALLKKIKVEHEYPHCWRCRNPVVFRITHQWFFKVEDLREKMLKENKRVHWVPDTAKNAYESWVGNLKDNSISRQRYWGTPLPIWHCLKCNNFKVIGSRQELKKEAGKIPANLHLPWIDQVTIHCKKCNQAMNRVPDVIDVWVDAGTASWNCLDNDPQKIKEWFPADFISEAKEQTRLWFSMLSIVSYLYFGKNSFKNVYVYGMLNDFQGQKMSKSLGNVISPYELIDKHGVDVMRFYMCQNRSGQDINFTWEECKAKVRSLLVLWNTHKLLITLSKETGINPFSLKTAAVEKDFALEEKYIFSRLHSVMKEITGLLDEYRLDETIAPLEGLFLGLSRTYIQMIREKSVGSYEEKKVCVYTIGQVLLESIKMFSIIAPFISEAMYLNLKEQFKLKEESIMHYSWPKADTKKINKKLEEQISLAQEIIQAGLHAREKAKLGVRWPVKEVQVISENPAIKGVVSKLQDVLCSQLNAKEVVTAAHSTEMQYKVKPDYAQIGPAYGKLSPQIIAKLALDSPQTIVNHLQKKGKYIFTIDNQQVEISKEMLFIEREAPHNYQLSEFKDVTVLVNTERTEELEAEGYAREVARNVQDLRKKAGMQKTDKIVLYLKVSHGMHKMLLSLKSEIQLKIGAPVFDLVLAAPGRKYKHTDSFKVKEKEFTAYFEKL
ncbi:MAG TPA: isoleucine--tRNA ligase [Candidatus Nanoarchaeia archaeon]|nr:isoleucine--tRNA ligase [Candidatus Nanoarchaeia archaeon]